MTDEKSTYTENAEDKLDIEKVLPIFVIVLSDLLGRLSDRYGRRPVLLVSQMGTLVGFMILGLASSLWMLFLSHIIDGISGANISTAQAGSQTAPLRKTAHRDWVCSGQRLELVLLSVRSLPSFRSLPVGTTIIFQRS